MNFKFLTEFKSQNQRDDSAAPLLLSLWVPRPYIWVAKVCGALGYPKRLRLRVRAETAISRY